MAYKSIVVHIDDSLTSEQRIGIAVRMARRFESRLTAMYSLGTKKAEVDITELPLDDIATRITEREARERVESMLRRTAAASALANVEIRVLRGDPVDAAIAEMRCADLSVIGQPDIENDKTGFGRRLMENAVLANGGPVLLIPYAGLIAGLGENVIVAWDGGREAARAVRDALPIIGSATRTTVLSLGNRSGPSEAAARSQALLATYLAAHGIRAELKSMPCTTDSAAELLLSQVADLDADLVVMGAYGHARVRELLFGGVTRTMFESMTVPVLMSN